MSTYDELNQQKVELERQIKVLMKELRPLKEKFAAITETIYRIDCEAARDKPVWELKINTGKTLETATYGEKILLCAEVTWQQMMDIATAYFADNGITGWSLMENSYKDWGQFHYKGGQNGGPVLGTFAIIKAPPNIGLFEEES